jgi:nitroimidazol reductase NimA-like FMN-containing flavoprotein (pyridoxamine 5'-phosphate oxidase superfamily)/N-acetylglutamate synthase-like GNAT family acetyltransferase
MRRAIYQGSEDEGRALLARTRAVHLAMVSENGAPILRTFDSVVDEGFLAFHGAPAGEKMEGIGRPVVAGASEIIASIPSYFLDPERACPATTYYVSVQAEGLLEQVDDPVRKARVLAALMAKYQPEGGHVPLSARHRLYEKAIAGLLVAQIRLDRVTCKAKLGQNRKPAERLHVIERLWQRGDLGDVEAVRLLLARFPELGPPAFLKLPDDVRDRSIRLQCAVDDAEIEEALPLLEGLYWLAARDGSGRIVAFARAVSDGKCAWIYDVAVAAHLRNARLGAALMGVLLDHPRVRGARHVRLSTKDAMPFYRRLGFCNLDEAPRYPWTSTDMIRTRVAPSERADETQARVVASEDRNHERPRDGA